MLTELVCNNAQKMVGICAVWLDSEYLVVDLLSPLQLTTTMVLQCQLNGLMNV